MLTSATVKGFSKDMVNGQISISFTLPEDVDLEKLKPLMTEGNTLDLRIEPHKAKRSRNANAYFHVLVSKLAGALTISKAHAKNLLITRYGQPMVDEDTGEIVTWKTALTPEIVAELESVHAIASGYEDNFTIYTLYRGCHEYNTKEMAELIEGTKSELTEIGISVE